MLGQETLSYGALGGLIAGIDGALSRLPSALAPRNFPMPETGRVMALALGNHPAAVPLLATAFTTRHAVMVMDPAWPEARLGEMLAEVTPDILFHLPEQVALAEAANALGISAIAVGPGLTVFEGFTAPPVASPPADPEDIFLIGFTSGTTSHPKAFARNRRSWSASLDAGREVFGLTPTSHTAAPGPLSHGVTLYALAETLDAGAGFVASTRFSAAGTAQVLRVGAVTRLVAVPAMIETLCQRGRSFPDITAVTTAGAKLDPALLVRAGAAFPNAVLTEYYGASELGFVSLSRHQAGRSDAPPHSVGHAFPHVDLSIRHDGVRVPDGQAGTVFVRGDLAISGYLGVAQDGFRREAAWATVGDLGRIERDGSLVLLGREGGMILSGGYNIYPGEIVESLRALAAVESAEVLALPHRLLGHVPVAVISGNGPFDLTAITAHCETCLPRYKIPQKVFVVQDWPRTTSGKVALAELETWVSNGDRRLVALERQT